MGAGDFLGPPERLAEGTLAPAAAFWCVRPDGSQATLWLDDLRASPDPGDALLDFLEAAWRVASVR